ncbi:MAG: PQQ-dependent sugar dehydrogenase, partial [Solirubrobacteraceae bacterium]|nr:PQQ-dependent sugar dehydrogenase [Solirubrobacteraceae bacterium]
MLSAPTVATAAGDPLTDEPVIPGVDWATDFQVAPNGDVYVAHHTGLISRYKRAAGWTTANPVYDLRPQTIYRFQTTREFDRGLVGITLDSSFATGQRYLYAIFTRGTTDFVEDAPRGNPNGIRRTGAVVKIAVPASGAASASDLTTILGKDAPADPNSACKPFTKGEAAASGETDAAPNGVDVKFEPDENGNVGTSGTRVAWFTEANRYPDGDLTTRADGGYDCLPSDSDTHGLGAIASAPDGTLFLTNGDASPYQFVSVASMRAYNLESLAGKVIHIDRDGRGVPGHPFCPEETDLTRTCTKIWARGMRNAFRFTLLPSDGGSGNDPVLAVGDVGNGTMERLTVTHPGQNLGWPCWEGTTWNKPFSDPAASSAVRTGWGGPELTPVGSRTSCERLAAGGVAGANPTQSAAVTPPSVEYLHEQRDPADRVGYPGAAIVSGAFVTPQAGADPAVALPSSMNGSL